jgi:thiamine kinase-like enzyme
MEKFVGRKPVSNTRKRLEQYLRDLSPGVLDVQDTNSIEILEMTPGAYNLNFHVRVDDREFVFRINIEQQSGLSDQIEYEFMALKFLEDHHLAPKAYHCDNNRDDFDFGILIEEYLEGPHLALEKGEIHEVADLLVRLHSLHPGARPFMTWRDPLADTYELARSDLIGYEAMRSPEKKTIILAKKLLARAEGLLDGFRQLYEADSLCHTDVVCDNVIKTSKGLRLIDWEKPRVDDPTYDVCCFLCEPAQLWCSQDVLTPEERESFLNTYVHLSGQEADCLRKKVGIREPLVSLHWILWGATKLCDLRNRLTVPELLQAHEERAARYERIAHPENIEKLLDRFDFETRKKSLQEKRP